MVRLFSICHGDSFRARFRARVQSLTFFVFGHLAVLPEGQSPEAQETGRRPFSVVGVAGAGPKGRCPLVGPARPVFRLIRSLLFGSLWEPWGRGQHTAYLMQVC